MCGNLYFIKEVRIDGGKHLYHNIIVALFTDSLNIDRQTVYISYISMMLMLKIENCEKISI